MTSKENEALITCGMICFCSHVSMYVCVFVPTPKGINTQWHDMVWYRLRVIG